jgi:hypothetical protein
LKTNDDGTLQIILASTKIRMKDKKPRTSFLFDGKEPITVPKNVVVYSALCLTKDHFLKSNCSKNLRLFLASYHFPFNYL